MKTDDKHFIPTTREIEIAPNIVYRPVRSWHSGTYAGEQVEIRDGDRSGCMRIIGDNNKMCNIPLTVVHRLYWHKKNPANTISAFLSFPDGMGSLNEYFWETLGTNDADIERFTGENAERDMEKKIIRVLNRVVERMAKARKIWS